MSLTANHTNPPIILASSSPYRSELLGRLQLPFKAVAPDVDETPLANETPEQTALRLAQQKAQALSSRFPETIIVGSDQVATLEGQQIGKPGNHANALKQLQLMRGKEVIFHTALCVLDNRSENQTSATRIQTHNCQTRVQFRDLSDAELDQYLRIEQPYDCAGSAKNEGLGIAIIAAIHSADPTSLTGLPLIGLCGMLRQLGVQFFTSPSPDFL